VPSVEESRDRRDRRKAPSGELNPTSSDRRKEKKAAGLPRGGQIHARAANETATIPATRHREDIRLLCRNVNARSVRYRKDEIELFFDRQRPSEQKWIPLPGSCKVVQVVVCKKIQVAWRRERSIIAVCG
jgi:hypothetical protein